MSDFSMYYSSDKVLIMGQLGSSQENNWTRKKVSSIELTLKNWVATITSPVLNEKD